MGRMTRTPAAAAGLAGRRAASALLLVSLLACSAEPPKEPEPTPGSEVALRVTTVSGTDGVDADTQAALEEQVGDVLSTYVEGGFLGDYPRQDFVRAFVDFTPGLAQDATGDIDVLTASSFEDASDVRATKLVARLSFTITGHTVVGATAHVDFRFEATTADGVVPVGLNGRLVLKYEHDTWTVFTYDVRSSDGTPVQAEVTS
jgi:hypothetical protein